MGRHMAWSAGSFGSGAGGGTVDGSFLGVARRLCRCAVAVRSEPIRRETVGKHVPLGTFLINVAGSACLGALYGAELSPTATLFWNRGVGGVYDVFHVRGGSGGPF